MAFYAFGPGADRSKLESRNSELTDVDDVRCVPDPAAELRGLDAARVAGATLLLAAGPAADYCEALFRTEAVGTHAAAVRAELVVSTGERVAVVVPRLDAAAAAAEGTTGAPGLPLVLVLDGAGVGLSAAAADALFTAIRPSSVIVLDVVDSTVVRAVLSEASLPAVFSLVSPAAPESWRCGYPALPAPAFLSGLPAALFSESVAAGVPAAVIAVVCAAREFPVSFRRLEAVLARGAGAWGDAWTRWLGEDGAARSPAEERAKAVAAAKRRVDSRARSVFGSMFL